MKSLLQGQKVLYINHALFAISILAAAHDFRIAQEWLFPAAAFLNAILWFGWSTRAIRAKSLMSVILHAPWLMLLPGVYFIVIGFTQANLLHASQLLCAVTTAAYLLSFLVAANLFSSTWDSAPLLKAIGIAAGIICIEGLVSFYFTSNGLRDFHPKAQIMHGASAYLEVRLRFPMNQANGMAMLFILLAAITLSPFHRAKTNRERLLWGGILGLELICSLLTTSRGGGVFMLLMLLIYAAYRLKAGRIAVIAAMFLFAGAGLYTLGKQGSLLRGNGSMRGRFHTWQASLNVLWRNPMFGGGPDAFRREWIGYAAGHGYVTTWDNPDGLYLMMLSSGGFLMLTMAVMAMVGTIWEVVRLLRSKAPLESREAVFFFTLSIFVVLGYDFLESTFVATPMRLTAFIFTGMLIGMRYQLLQKAVAGKVKDGVYSMGSAKREA